MRGFFAILSAINVVTKMKLAANVRIGKSIRTDFRKEDNLNEMNKNTGIGLVLARQNWAIWVSLFYLGNAFKGC
jgi:hypothetical protein